MKDWKTEALELSLTGMSWRSIAKQICVPKSTVSDYLRTVKPRVSKAQNVELELNGKSVCIIADTQCKPDIDMSYLAWIGKYINEKRPDVIVHIGDHFDMPSLSSYDKGTRGFEGRRVSNDIIAGQVGMRLLVSQWQHDDSYKPRMVFCVGNHENRIDRAVNAQSELSGLIGVDELKLEQYGWEVVPFLKPIEIDGIFYCHYMSNPMNGKPYGGTAANILKIVGRSFVVGHKQVLDIAIRGTIDGKQQIGIVNGAAYTHFEDYKGYVGNNHFRGITMLHEVHDGFGLPMFVSMSYLASKYS